MRFRRTPRILLLSLVVLPLVVVAAGCGRSGGNDNSGNGGGGGNKNLSGTIVADGSSTVGPLTTYAAEQFQQQSPNVKVTVGISGTGGGFERFCAGETDLSDASRQIEDDEAAVCKKADIDYTEFQVANDGIAIVVNTENDWVDCLTLDQLKKIWEPKSKVKSWKQIDPSFPDEKLSLFGPGTDSGTFDFFTDKITGEEGASRSDYQASENDNVLVEGVAGEKGGLGYFGLSYAEQNQDKIKAVGVDGGSGCVTPSTETVQSGEYQPLSRPLFVYVKSTSFKRPEVKAFMKYMIDNYQSLAEGAQFVPMTDDQAQASEDAFQQTGA